MSDLVEDVLQVLSSRTPFPYSEIKSFYYRHNSIDLLINCMKFSAVTGMTCELDRILKEYLATNNTIPNFIEESV